VDRQGAAWLAETVEEASRAPTLEDFDKSSSEGRKLSVRGGRNKGGRFLEVVARVDDDQMGIIWIPKARSRQGWWRFVSKLRSWLVVLDSAPGSSSLEVSVPEEESRGSLQGVEAGWTFTEAQRSPSREVEELVGPKLWSSQEINFFPVASSFELGFDGKVERSAWDCSEMESGFVSPLLVRVAAGYEGEEACFECGFPVPIPARVAVSGRRKKMKNFGLLGLGMGLGKMGLGISRLGSRLLGPGPRSVSGSSGLVLGSDFGSIVFSR
jgi:hypothetical protein